MAEDELLGQSQGKKGSIFDRMVAQKAEMVRQEEETATQLRRAAIEQRKERAAAAVQHSDAVESPQRLQEE
jgi:hypothetical protein